MTYHIARNGQTYGPYTPAEVERYLASGNILPSDFAQAAGTTEWLPVFQLFPKPPATPGTTPAGAPFTPPAYTTAPNTNAGYAPNAGYNPNAGYAQSYASAAFAPATPIHFNPGAFPDPPNLPWWLALILGIVTGGAFFVVWDIVQAAWMRRVDPRSNALYLYVAAAVLFLINLQASWHSIAYWMFDSPFIPTHHSGLVAVLRWVVWLVARFVLRSDLLTHFNTAEPVGLRLSGFLTLILGGLYFQYHFNQINLIKRSLRSLRFRVPAV